MKINLNLLPEDIIFEIENRVYQSIHYKIYEVLLSEFESYILEKNDEYWDMGSTILARLDGMPLLERI
tara:strand:- start:26 stop:229 length:204 start_codon:yes stop_codon:yes gene_type:complete